MHQHATIEKQALDRLKQKLTSQHEHQVNFIKNLLHISPPRWVILPSLLSSVCQSLQESLYVHWKSTSKSWDCVICLHYLCPKCNLTGINLTIFQLSVSTKYELEILQKKHDRDKAEVRKTTSVVKRCFHLLFAFSLLQQPGVNYLVLFFYSLVVLVPSFHLKQIVDTKQEFFFLDSLMSY